MCFDGHCWAGDEALRPEIAKKTPYFAEFAMRLVCWAPTVKRASEWGLYVPKRKRKCMYWCICVSGASRFIGELLILATSADPVHPELLELKDSGLPNKETY